MPLSTLITIIGGVIVLAAITVAVVVGFVPAGMAGWALPGALLAAIIARYTLSRL